MVPCTKIHLGLLLAFGGAASVLPAAQAQDTGAPQRVEVTGSNIRRIDAETPSPVQVITAQDMRRSGYTSVSDVLQNLTANGQGSLSQGFSASFATGASGVALRGLSVGATLVLIDGHRSAPYPLGDDGQRSFVDISNLPFDAVDRIEVLKDGASAIYGSDAIAGVVNIILKKSFVGLTLSADGGTSSPRNDGATRRTSIMWGRGDLDQDGHNFFVSGEFRKRDQIRFVDRGGIYTRSDFSANGGLDVTPGVPNELTGPLPSSRTGYITDSNGNITGFMPGCDATRLAAHQCAFHDTLSQIQPATENANFIAHAALKLPQGWQLALQGSYFESRAQQVGPPSQTYTNGYQGVAFGPGVAPTLLAALPPTTISASNPSFPAATGTSSGILHYTFLDLGPRVTDSDARTSRFTADLDGTWGDWDLAASAGYSQVRLNLQGHGYVNPANLQTALDSTTDPYLVGGDNSAAVRAFVAPTLVSNDVSTLSFLHLGGSRDVASLPGGPLSLALGGDYVYRRQDARAPQAAADGSLSSYVSNNFTIGTQSVASGYGEMVAPLTKTLEAEAAVRYDHYNISGGKASPKFGMKWSPTPEFALRGTFSRGFRAPGPAENGTAGQTSARTIYDPVLCVGNDPTAAGNFPSQCTITNANQVQQTNKALKPETSKSYTLGFILEPSHEFSASVDFYAIEIDRQIVTVDGTTDTAVRGTNLTPLLQVQADGSTMLVTPPVAPIAYLTASYVNANTTKTSGIDVDLRGQARLGGLGTLTSELMLTYMNRYDLEVDGTVYHLAGTHGPSSVSGDTGNPRTRIKWANTWSYGATELTGTVSYIGGYSLTDPSNGMPTCADGLFNGAGAYAYGDQLESGVVPGNLNCHVSSFTTFDLAGRYRWDAHLSLHGSVMNLFNRGAPVDWGTYGGGTAPYNPSLHMAGAIGRYVTLGATYSF